MRRTLVACTVVLLWLAGYSQASGTQSSTSSVPTASAQLAALSKYCFTCHNNKWKPADLSLKRAAIAHPADNAAIWEKVLHKLRAREMPPPRMPRPDDAT